MPCASWQPDSLVGGHPVNTQATRSEIKWSADGGATWGAATQLAGPMALASLASTSQGRMVGDYISTSFAGGSAHGVFAVANPPNGTTFDEAMYTPVVGLSAARAASVVNDPVLADAADHPIRSQRSARR